MASTNMPLEQSSNASRRPADMPLRVYQRPNGLVRVLRVDIGSTWGPIAMAMAQAGVEFSLEYVDKRVGYALSADFGDDVLVYTFTDMQGTPCSTLVKAAYAAFMLSEESGRARPSDVSRA